MKNKLRLTGICIAMSLLSVNCYARIKLITLPVREHVEIQLENQQKTIIEEERIVPLTRGHNEIDFSWQNTTIDPETLVFRVLPGNTANTMKVNVLSVSYPPGEDALTWQVSASENGTARVRITYAIAGIEKKYHYIANTDSNETQMSLSQYLRLDNSSNEEYARAAISSGYGKPIELPLGLSETQEVLVNSYSGIPVVKSYTANAAEFDYRDKTQDKLNVLMHYNLHNDKEHQLGEYALPYGKVRIYQNDQQQSSVFIGEDWNSYTPLQAESRLYIGQARDIVVKRIIEKKEQQQINGNLYNIDVLVKYEIENFKDQPAELIIEESLIHLRNEVFSSHNPLIEWQLGKDNTFTGQPLEKKTTAEKLAYNIKLPARTTDGKAEKVVRKLNIILRNEW